MLWYNVYVELLVIFEKNAKTDDLRKEGSADISAEGARRLFLWVIVISSKMMRDASRNSAAR